MIKAFYQNAAMAILAGLGWCGCATYPEQIQPCLLDLKNNVPTSVEQKVGESALKGNDRLLYLMEKGRIAQIQGREEESRTALAEVVDSIVVPVEQEASAVEKGAATAVAQTTAVLWNDTAIPYQADVYESQMAIQLQLENYLLSGDSEIRGKAINFVQRCYAQGKLFQALRERQQRELSAADQDKSDDAASSLGELENKPEWKQMSEASTETAAKVSNSYDNAYCWYLAGMVYEMYPYDFSGSDRACYEKAWRIFPENTCLQRDLYRTAKRDGLDALAEEVAKAHPGIADIPTATDDSGDLVVVFQDGFVAQKREVKIPIPLIYSGQLNSVAFIAFPYYDTSWTPPSALTVYEGESKLGTTEPICYVNSLAVKALKEKIWPIATRQVIRLVAKSAATIAITEAAKQNDAATGLLVGIGAGIANYASENADLRAWYTLPENIQLLRTRLPAGKHSLRAEVGGGATTLEIEVTPGSRTWIRIVRPGGLTLNCQSASYRSGRP